MRLPRFRKQNGPSKTPKRKIHQSRLLQAVEYRHFKTLRIIHIVILFLSLAGIIYIGYFLYNKIYTTIGQVQNIILIDAQMQGNILDFSSLEKTLSEWDDKHNTTTPEIIRDPFSIPYAQPTVPPAPPDNLEPIDTPTTP